MDSHKTEFSPPSTIRASINKCGVLNNMTIDMEFGTALHINKENGIHIQIKPYMSCYQKNQEQNIECAESRANTKKE
jgi:hypothetical protein